MFYDVLLYFSVTVKKVKNYIAKNTILEIYSIELLQGKIGTCPFINVIEG